MRTINLKDMRRIWVSILLLLFLLTPFSIWAGDGQFHGPTWDGDTIKEVGKIDIYVLLDADNTMLDQDLEEYFERISEELYNATEKQLQLGSVTIYRGAPDGKKKADLLVSSKIAGAYTYAGNFGQSGAYARIYLNPSDISSGYRPTVVHEMGHLVLNIYDSYLGFLQDSAGQSKYLAPRADGTGYEWRGDIFDWNPNKTPVPSPDRNNTFYDTTDWDTDSLACIMDGPWAGETEFSTPSGKGWATDHVLPFEKDFTWSTAPNGSALDPPFTAHAKVVTKQNDKNNNKSAWETIVEKRPSMRIPKTVPTSDISSHQPIDFQVVPLLNELSICMDRSGSMGGTPLALAKVAAGIVIGLTHERYDIEEPSHNKKVPIAGDYLSVATFNQSGSLVFSDGGHVAQMTLANKVLALAAIAPISASGTTSIGAGLIRSRDTFTATADIPKSIILLSDGQENTSPYVSAVKQSLIDKGIRVYSVGLGSGADKDLLQQVADDTGGEFFFATSAFQLPGIFATLYGNLRNDGFLKVVGSILGASTLSAASAQSSTYETLLPQVATNTAANSHSEAVKVDAAVGEATFLLTWNTSIGYVNLIDPDGNIITSQNVSSFPNVTYSDGAGFAMYRVTAINAGNWTVNLSSDPLLEVQWELRVFAVDSIVQFEAQAEKSSFIYPEPVIIKASCVAPQPVIGGHATAFVVRPDGSIIELDLLDNGNSVNADEFANDGMYSGRFASFSTDGVYTVTAKFDSTGGMTPTPSNTTGIEFSIPDPCAPPLIPEPVESFERYRQFTFSISGVVVDNTPPTVQVIVPDTGDAVQDGITLTANANDEGGVVAVSFYVREPNSGNGVPIAQEDLAGTFNGVTGKWECLFDTTQLQDGYYVVLAKAVDTYGNVGWSQVVPFSIRNWAVIKLLPATPSSKAGRTMPAKFSIRIAQAVDPAMPFVYNEDLEIRVYKSTNPSVILQRSRFGTGSTDYRIDIAGEKYITNFKTLTTPATYVVEIWRPEKNFKVGSFTFKTVK